MALRKPTGSPVYGATEAYGKSGTDIAYGATEAYGKSGTDIAYGAGSPSSLRSHASLRQRAREGGQWGASERARGREAGEGREGEGERGRPAAGSSVELVLPT
eukprot:2041221-Rhodomonas_salina.3